MVSAQEVLDTQIATVFITFLLWVFTLIPMRIAQRRSGFDNNNPRQGNDKLDGWGLRAMNSNLNALEALVFITAATCMNIFGARKDEGVGAATMAFSIIFIICRAIHPILYHFEYATHRSVSWGISMLCVFVIFILAFIH